MQKMPQHAEATVQVPQDTPRIASPSAASDWRDGLPVLAGNEVVLRELRMSDAPALFTLLSTGPVARFISPPHASVAGFERFISWTLRQRAAGTYGCYAVTLTGYDTAIGLFQVRQLEPGFQTAEWGFALGAEFWGTGLFRTSAELVLGFAFDTLHVHRLEARACLANGRGIGALRKLGAYQEAVLRRSFHRGSQFLDQALFTIIGDEWRSGRAAYAAPVRVSVH